MRIGKRAPLVVLCAFASACGGSPAPPGAPPGPPDAATAPAAPPAPNVEAARWVADWELVCIAGPEGKKDHNECAILTFTKLSDDAFFFGGGFYGSAHVGTHVLKKGAFRTALAGVVDRTGNAKWAKGLGVSWHNEITGSVAIDAHHVMVTGLHGPAFDASLPHRAVKRVVVNGVTQDMGYKAEESFVAAFDDEGKLAWVKNTLDVVGAPWNEDLGSPGGTLESDGAGGAFGNFDWNNTQYRIHFDAKGASQIVSQSVRPAAPGIGPFPATPPNRYLSFWRAQTTPRGTWRLMADNPKSNNPFADIKPGTLWSQNTENVLWHVDAAGTWNADLGRGERRGDAALFVTDDGVAFAIAPRAKSAPGYGTFSEISLFRVEENGKIAWSSPLWGLTLPPSQSNSVDATIPKADARGDVTVDALYRVPIVVQNVRLPPPTNVDRGARVKIEINAMTGATQKVEWLETPRGCFTNVLFAHTVGTVDLSTTERLVAGDAYGDWDTAGCGAATGSGSVVAKFSRVPPSP